MCHGSLVLLLGLKLKLVCWSQLSATFIWSPEFLSGALAAIGLWVHLSPAQWRHLLWTSKQNLNTFQALVWHLLQVMGNRHTLFQLKSFKMKTNLFYCPPPPMTLYLLTSVQCTCFWEKAFMIISKSTEQFRPLPFVDNFILPSKGCQRNDRSDCGVGKGGKLEKIQQKLGNF